MVPQPDTRSSRLRRQKERGRKFAIREPRVVRRQETKAALVFAAIIAAVALLLAVVDLSGAAAGANTRAIMAFGLGIILVCAFASCLTPLIVLRHRLLLITLGSGLIAAGAFLVGVTPLESAAKIAFGASAGLWLALMLTSIGQVLLISALIIIVDFYSVFLGPTKRMVESGGRWIEYFTINMPVFGEDAVSRLGISDIIFFSLFLGCALTFRLRRTLSALAMTASFVATMVVGVLLDIGVPALPLLSIFFVLVNADLLYRRYLEEPDAGGSGPS